MPPVAELSQKLKTFSPWTHCPDAIVKVIDAALVKERRPKKESARLCGRFAPNEGA
jgi:hypothetical protein